MGACVGANWKSASTISKPFNPRVAMIPAIHPLGCFVARLIRTSECLMFSLHQFWAQENQKIELDKTRLKTR